MSTKSKEVDDDVPLSSSAKFHHQEWSKIVNDLHANYPSGLSDEQVNNRLQKTAIMRLIKKLSRSG